MFVDSDGKLIVELSLTDEEVEKINSRKDKTFYTAGNGA